jgi:hypothetical protein
VNRLGETIRFIKSVKPQHARTFATTVVPEVVRPARVIWNQAIGAIFLILAIPAVNKILQILRQPVRDEQSSFALILSIIWSAVMIALGLMSLLKARRIGARR